MKSFKIRKKAKRSLSAVLVLVLTLCMTAGLLPVMNPVFAASEFKYPSPFSKTGYSTYYHKGKYTGNVIVNGVDISDWQSKNCRFGDAKKAGVDFAIMRVTYTSYGKKDLQMHIDEKFYAQYTNAKANGVMTGVYVFSQATNASEGVKEARYAVKRLQALGIGPEDLNLPIYMDYEFAGGIFGRMHGISRTNATNAAVGFCNAIKSAGYTPGIYANTTFFSSYLSTQQFANDVDLWCAQYYNRNQSAVNYSKWQYSSSARINGMLSYTGFQGNIDADFWYISKKTAKSTAVTKITGRTTLSVKDAKAPKFKLYNGTTLLREGVDYCVGGIRNNAVGNGYAYITGIGKYGGYALIPIKIASKSSGKTTAEITCSNHLRIKYKGKSKYISVANRVTYKKGNTYVVQDYLNIRKGPGTNYDKVLRSSLPTATKNKTVSGNTTGVLKPGSKVKCLKVSGDWIKIDGGWVCCRMGNEVYLK